MGQGEKRSEEEWRMTRQLEPWEEEALRVELERGGSLECPLCGTRLHTSPQPPRSDISYVRHRVLLACDSCGLRVVLDRKPSGP